MDRNNILMQMALDKKLREWGREDLAAAFDWYSHASFRLMGPVSASSCAKGNWLLRSCVMTFKFLAHFTGTTKEPPKERGAAEPLGRR
jgi:hypothetical protein